MTLRSYGFGSILDGSISDEGSSDCLIYSAVSGDKHFRGKKVSEGEKEGERRGWGVNRVGFHETYFIKKPREERETVTVWGKNRPQAVAKDLQVAGAWGPRGAKASEEGVTC